jgi:hypothetical protein
MERGRKGEAVKGRSAMEKGRRGDEAKGRSAKIYPLLHVARSPLLPVAVSPFHLVRR